LIEGYGNRLKRNRTQPFFERQAGISMHKLKIFLIAVLAGILVCIVSVSSGDALAQREKTVKVLTSFYPMYILALNVAKDVPGVSVLNLTPSFTGCLHNYALTTKDMKKIADADVFVANGAGMESFLDKVIAQYPKLKIIKLAEGVTFIKEGKEVNPHVWVSVSNAITQARNLGKAMEIFDPFHAELYRRNTAGYVNKLEALRQKMQSELAPYKGRQIITFHEAFPYFAREFGLEIAAVVERNPAETIDLIKKAGIKALFSEPQYLAQAAEVIAKETSAKVYVLDPAVTGPDDADAYIKIMEDNLKVLKEALR
jgi:zinc transport system substrate-binding protein